jgi:NitT/TauT family transport system permease protein
VWVLDLAGVPTPAAGDAGGEGLQITTLVPSRVIDAVWYVIVAAGAAYCGWNVVAYLSTTLSRGDLGKVLLLSAITMLRVAILIFLASLVWVPLGVMIGLRPRWAEKIQPLAWRPFPPICYFRSPW